MKRELKTSYVFHLGILSDDTPFKSEVEKVVFPKYAIVEFCKVKSKIYSTHTHLTKCFYLCIHNNWGPFIMGKFKILGNSETGKH